MCIAMVGQPATSSISRGWTIANTLRSISRSIRRARPPAIAARRLVFERLLGKGGFFAYLPTLGEPSSLRAAAIR